MEAVNAVFRDFYVDDLLKSFAGEEHAIELSKELQELLARGALNSRNGFQIRAVFFQRSQSKNEPHTSRM